VLGSLFWQNKFEDNAAINVFILFGNAAFSIFILIQDIGNGRPVAM
jgi:hypothetical protein